MSRSNPTEQLINPSKFFFSWNGGDGGFRYYDKTKGDKGENITVPYPFDFLVLDTCVTLKGYNEPENKGYWSNEVKSMDIGKAKFIVRSKSGIECIGSYKECKEKLGTKGLDYVASVYVAYKSKEGLVMANLQLKGAAVGPWINFCKANDINKIAIRVDSHTEEKKGRVSFFAPVFKAITKVNEESEKSAQELDKQLQAYLSAYFERQSGLNEQTLEQTVESANKPQEQPKEQPKAAVTPEPEYHYDPSADNEEMPF